MAVKPSWAGFYGDCFHHGWFLKTGHRSPLVLALRQFVGVGGGRALDSSQNHRKALIQNEKPARMLSFSGAGRKSARHASPSRT
jgi:hypothetical protein